MAKTVGTILILAAAAALGWFYPLWAAAAAPVFALAMWRLWTASKPDIGEFVELKSGPPAARQPGRFPLDGNWEFKWPGCEWTSIKTPCDLATLDRPAPGGGVFRFRRRVEYPAAPPGKRIFFCGGGFGGVGAVFIDGERAGGRIFGFLPFELDLTDRLRGGGEFELRFDIRALKGGRGPGKSRSLGPPYGMGLFRELWLEAHDQVRITCSRIEGAAGADTVDVVVMLEGKSAAPTAVSVKLESAAGGEKIFEATRLAPGFDGRAEVRFEAPRSALKVWSPERPELYRLTVQAACDELRLRGQFTVGWSAFGVADGRICRDGKPVAVYGLRRCENYPPYGAAVPKWAGKKDAQVIKEMLLNAVYCEDFPPHPDFRDDCDRAGVYLISEFPLRELRGAVGEARAAEMFAAATAEALSHPSFLFWSVPGGADAALALEALSRIGAADRLAVAGGGIELLKEDIDLYEGGPYEPLVRRFAESGAGLLTLDFIDTAGGREDRRGRELRKAAADLAVLKAARAAGAETVVLGQLFSWGIRQGVLSVNRQKKASADAIREYMKTHEVNEPGGGPLPAEMQFRSVALALAAFVFAWIVISTARGFFLSAPPLYLCFHDVGQLWPIAAAMLPASAISLSLLFERRRGRLPGIAEALGYPLMMSLYNRPPLRAALILAAHVYFCFLGTIALAAAAGTPLAEAARPVMMAAALEAALLVFLFAPLAPAVALAGAALLQWVYISWFLHPAAALLFVAVRWLPWIALMAWIDRRDIFSGARDGLARYAARAFSGV